MTAYSRESEVLMRHSVLTVLVATFFLVSCSSTSDSILSTPYEADWADGASTAMAESLTDPADDFEIGADGAPPYTAPVAYSPIDVTQVVFGMSGDYLYMQLDFNGIIPTGPQTVSASGEVEQQSVLAQSFNFALDTDNSDATGGSGGGVDGVDLCFGIHAEYGANFQINAAYGIGAGPIDTRGGQLQGELGAGGPGTNYVLVRFDVSAVSTAVLPRGSSVEIGGWSVAESNLYDGLSTDTLRNGSWTVPHAPVGGAGGGSEGSSTILPI